MNCYSFRSNPGPDNGRMYDEEKNNFGNPNHFRDWNVKQNINGIKVGDLAIWYNEGIHNQKGVFGIFEIISINDPQISPGCNVRMKCLKLFNRPVEITWRDLGMARQGSGFFKVKTDVLAMFLLKAFCKA